MIFPKSESKLITVLIHFLVWAVFGTIYFTQPLAMHVPIPFQLWIKEVIVFGLLVIAYYLNSTILIPNFLLKNYTGIYLLIVTGIIALIVILNSYLDFWLNIHRLVEAAFQKLGPPKHRGGGPHTWNIPIIA
ncbi:MAG TPA: hypothetical protein VGI43_10080, partial [Mucilaginibacter sp.]